MVRDHAPAGLGGLYVAPVLPFRSSGTIHPSAPRSGAAERSQLNGIAKRHNLRVTGQGATTLVFVHGYGCGQAMWRFVAQRLARRYRVVLLDLVGNGASDRAAYDPGRHAALDGHAQDIVEVVRHAVPEGPAVLVGHSVGCMIGLLAHLQDPEPFVAHVMVSPSPCYLDDGDYRGGFTRSAIETLLDALEDNHAGWARAMAPTIMGAPGRPELAAELEASFCNADPLHARQFARATFLSDHRAELKKLAVPTLVLQSSTDVIAPPAVGEYVHRTLPRASYRLIENVGHCPHLSAPEATTDAIEAFLAER